MFDINELSVPNREEFFLSPGIKPDFDITFHVPQFFNTNEDVGKNN